MKTRANQLKRWNRFCALLDLEFEDFLDRVGNTEAKLIKRRVLLEQEGRCNKCLNYEWMGHPITIELEHKDGNSTNHSRENIECLCPNCHAMTKTWRGRNKNSGAYRNRVSDDVLLAALRREPSIRKALISVGLAGKGSNYNRAYSLLANLGS